MIQVFRECKLCGQRWLENWNLSTQRIKSVLNAKKKPAFFAKLISTDTDMNIDMKSKENLEAWRLDMEGHAHKFVELCCEMGQQSVDPFHNVSTPLFALC